MINYSHTRKRFSILFIGAIFLGCLPNIIGYFYESFEKYSPPLLLGFFLGVFILELLATFKYDWLIGFIVEDKSRAAVEAGLKNYKSNIKLSTIISAFILVLLYSLWFIGI